MSAKTDAFENEILDFIFTNVASGAISNLGSGLLVAVTPGDIEISLHETYPGEAGDQTTGEADFGSYARIPIPRATVTGWTVTGDTVDNAIAVTFATATADAANPNTIMFWGAGTDNTGVGNLMYKGHFGGAPAPFVADDTLTADTVSQPDHPFVVDDRVVFYALPGDTLPTGMVEGTVYHIRTAGLTANAYTISLTQGGGIVTFTSDGAGYAAQVTPRTVDTGDQFEIAIGDLNITEA